MEIQRFRAREESATKCAPLCVGSAHAILFVRFPKLMRKFHIDQGFNGALYAQLGGQLLSRKREVLVLP